MSHELVDPTLLRVLDGQIETLTTSGKSTLDESLMKDMKRILKQSDEFVSHLFYTLMTLLGKDHCEIRLSAFQIMDQIFNRSHVFRELVIDSFQRIMDMVLETDPEQPLPLPKATAFQLKVEAMKAVHGWHQKYSDTYKKLSLGYNFLKNCKKIDFMGMEARSIAQRRRVEEEQRRKEAMERQKINAALSEMEEMKGEISECITQAENCLMLLLPEPEDFNIHSLRRLSSEISSKIRSRRASRRKSSTKSTSAASEIKFEPHENLPKECDVDSRNISSTSCKSEAIEATIAQNSNDSGIEKESDRGNGKEPMSCLNVKQEPNENPDKNDRRLRVTRSSSRLRQKSLESQPPVESDIGAKHIRRVPINEHVKCEFCKKKGCSSQCSHYESNTIPNEAMEEQSSDSVQCSSNLEMSKDSQKSLKDANFDVIGRSTSLKESEKCTDERDNNRNQPISNSFSISPNSNKTSVKRSSQVNDDIQSQNESSVLIKQERTDTLNEKENNKHSSSNNKCLNPAPQSNDSLDSTMDIKREEKASDNESEEFGEISSGSEDEDEEEEDAEDMAVDDGIENELVEHGEADSDLEDVLDAIEGGREHGLTSQTMTINVQLPNDRVEVEETPDNEDVLCSLNDCLHSIQHGFMPKIQKWIQIFTKVGDETQIKRCIDTRNVLDRVVTKISKLDIKKSSRKTQMKQEDGAEDSDEDFEEVASKDGFEADVPEHLKELQPIPQGSNKSSTPMEWRPYDADKDMETDPTSYQASVKRIQHIKGSSGKRSKDSKFSSPPSQSTSNDLTHANSVSIKSEVKDILSTSNASYIEGTHTEEESRKSELLKRAPVMPFNTDLRHWGERIEAPLRVNYITEHRFWTPNHHDDDSVDKDALAAMTSRIINYTGKFEPVQHQCRAPIAGGKLCPRMDRYKCPFHGKIIKRDAMGRPIDPEDQEKEREKQNSSEVPAWEDKELQREIEAATGKTLQRPEKKRGRKKKEPKYPHLTDINKKINTSRSRLENKVLNPRALKRVAEKLNVLDRKRIRDKFGNQFHYALENKR